MVCSGPRITELGRSMGTGRPGFGTLCGRGLRGWGDTCLGFHPRSMVSWTVTLEPLVPSRTQLPFLNDALVARW